MANPPNPPCWLRLGGERRGKEAECEDDEERKGRALHGHLPMAGILAGERRGVNGWNHTMLHYTELVWPLRAPKRPTRENGQPQT